MTPQVFARRDVPGGAVTKKTFEVSETSKV